VLNENFSSNSLTYFCKKTLHKKIVCVQDPSPKRNKMLMSLAREN
jgi:hypothetical protein